MSKIHVLTPSVAERIAAGEVVERPASVVKELVENSLDAGATEVLVRLEDGGKSFIEVLDNGVGMSAEDLQLCVERHATSKLNSVEDLDKIRTLGFRGEAIPSIAASADLCVLSREKDSECAFEMDVGEIAARFNQRPQPKKVTFGQFIRSSHGTRIQVRSLFSQIPARLKFLKSQAAEVAQVREWLERIALAYPGVGFQLFSQDKLILHLRPQTEKERVHALLSDGDDFPLITISNEQDGMRDLGLQIRLHWLQGLSVPHTRKLIQVVNCRAVRDKVLQQALLNPFRQVLLPGQFPALALFIEIQPAALDVNVHPTKTEIRFLDSRKIFQTVESLAKEMISQRGTPAIIPSAVPSEDTSGVFSQEHFQKNSSGWKKSSMPQGSKIPPPLPKAESLWDSVGWKVAESGQSHQNFSHPQQSLNVPFETKSSPTSEVREILPETPSLKSLFLSSGSSIRSIGILFNTYLLYENQNELILVDQHAAHERIRYEALRKRVFSPQSSSKKVEAQVLLIPETVKFSPESRSVLEARMHWLSELGFEAEIFGEDVLLFRSIPVEWGMQQLKFRLKNVTEKLIHLEPEENASLMDENLFEQLASEACHSAVRAGDILELEEAKMLVEQLFECEHPWNCPHGRPTIVQVAKTKLEEWFQRKVGEKYSSFET